MNSWNATSTPSVIWPCNILYGSGSQTVVRVPVVVREGFSGGTRAAFWSNSKFYASLLLQVSQSTSLFVRIYSSVIQMLLIRLCAKVILGTVHLSNYILLKPGGTFQHKKNTRWYAITKSLRTTALRLTHACLTVSVQNRPQSLQIRS